jgi:hypothetical protein
VAPGTAGVAVAIAENDPSGCREQWAAAARSIAELAGLIGQWRTGLGRSFDLWIGVTP